MKFTSVGTDAAFYFHNSYDSFLFVGLTWIYTAR